MKRYYLGLNANGPKISECLFGRGTKQDLRKLNELLAGRYKGAPILTKNGRSALALALKAYFDGGDKIIITGFTCHAVYEAVVEAGMTPIFADINRKDLNFDLKTLNDLIKSPTGRGAKGIIVQNTLGNLVDIREIEKFARDHGLLIVEDLAHSAGGKYLGGKMAGTVGVATALSFSRDKSINAITGGAVIMRAPQKHEIEAPFKIPRFSDTMRARLYPMFMAMCRKLGGVHLGGALMRFLIFTHLVERTADNKLDFRRRPPRFIAKIVIGQIEAFHHRGEGAIRDFYLVRDRDEVLAKLSKAGYYFDGFWYEKAVSPARYYKEVKFPEKKCPVGVKVAEEIINFPKCYSQEELDKAYKIIQPYLVKEAE